jgi:hypothetical protein
MKKKGTHNKANARQEKAFPFLNIPLEQRLIQSGSIDLKNNWNITEKNGYWVVTPKDSEKRKK